MKAYNSDGTLNKAFIKYMRYNSICIIDKVTYLRHCYYDDYSNFHWAIEDFNNQMIIYSEIENEEKRK